MTDYEKLKNLLTEFGIEFIEESYNHWLLGEVNGLTCRVGKNKIIGERRFQTDFKFKYNGSFIEMEVLEE